MHTFEITIQRKSGEGWPVVTVEQKASAFLPIRKEGVFKVDEEELLRQVTPREYGTTLGKALFQENIRDAFVQALRASGDSLRVLLFVEAPDLRTWRWERLCALLDDTWDFLALNQRTPFSLYLPSLTDRLFPPIGRRDLRALVLVASPAGLEEYGLNHFNVETAASSVKTALGEIPCDVLAEVEKAAGPPTLDALCGRLTQEPYTLLHVICHGQVDQKSKDTNLFLASGDVKKPLDRVGDAILIDRLRKLGVTHGLPRLAFLATCESASQKAEGALGGLAQRLVRELGMPAVVAMTEKVSLKTAEALAEGFYWRIREHGEVDRALAEATAALAGRYDITVPALFSRLGGRPLFSDTLDRPLTAKEIEFGLSRLGDLVKERAPVLSPEFEGYATTLRGTLGVDIAGLSPAIQDEREKGLEEVNELCGEALDLSFIALAMGQEPPAYYGRCPFRGLYPFKLEDREFFFGREKLVETLHRKLAEHNFLAVLGPSGCGKSSVVMAGLIPALQSRELGLEMDYMTPGSAPLIHLEAALAQAHGSSAVLVVDQFEELFTLCTDENKRWTFLDRLLSLIKDRRVVITMRADFWGDCAPYTALKEAMLTHQELIAPMDAAELRRAMEGQAQKVGLRFEADLSNTILDDVQGEPGAMPLLQHTLLELWKRRHGRWLRAAEYRAIGGVQQAIARTADDTFRRLSPDDQERARDIFVRLTRLDEGALHGEDRRDTRRRVSMRELVPAGSDPGVTKVILKHLADDRLVVTSVNRATGTEEVEVTHEALIRYWPRLRGWLEENRASLKVLEGIREAAIEWGNGQRENSLLIHRRSRLEDAEALSGDPRFPLNQLERDYVSACAVLEEEEKQRAEKQRRVALDAFYSLTYEVPRILSEYPNTDEIRKQIVDRNLNQLERLLEVDRDTRILRELATNHRLLGTILIELNELKKAYGAFQKSIKFCEELIECEPSRAFWHRDCAVSHFNIAYILERQGDQPGARSEYAAAREYAEKSVDLDPSNHDWKKLLSDCKSKLERLGDGPGKARSLRKKTH